MPVDINSVTTALKSVFLPSEEKGKRRGNSKSNTTFQMRLRSKNVALSIFVNSTKETNGSNRKDSSPRLRSAKGR